MSEEEKQAIEDLKARLYGNEGCEFIDVAQSDLRIFLSLIDKQQKEIEMLKAITQNYNAIGGETFGDDRIIVCSMKYFNGGYFKRNYISKDKIREQIKELERLNKEQEIPVLKEYKFIRKEMIKYFKKLIGEE